jgi:signal transduction histidine kinase
MQWWARLGALVILGELIRQIWRWRVHAMLRRQRELERAVADRTQKLAQEHDLALREKARAENETGRVESQKIEIERLLWEARQAERVKSEFVANMSHEVRTPLNAILGTTDLILQSPLNEDQAECLRTVKSSSEALLALMNGVLDFSNLEGAKVRLDCAEFDLPAVVQDAIDSYAEPARNKRLQIRTRLLPNFPARLVGDAPRVRQVVANLVENAIKFTEHGFVELMGGAQSITPDHVILHVQVRDTGIGISREQQALIFEPFRQADGSSSRRHGGTGLGLAMCSRLIGLMNGHIWVESAQGAGSTFHFTAQFGIARDQHSASAGSGTAAPASGLGLQILLVEDNVVNQKLARRILENTGHTVTCASDGLQALEACDRSRFDAILMDIQMPIMDGFEATAELRKRERLLGLHTPVLALTANAMEGDREKCLAAGMDGYVTKPINTAELLKSIAGLVGSPARS